MVITLIISTSTQVEMRCEAIRFWTAIPSGRMNKLKKNFFRRNLAVRKNKNMTKTKKKKC